MNVRVHQTTTTEEQRSFSFPRLPKNMSMGTCVMVFVFLIMISGVQYWCVSSTLRAVSSWSAEDTKIPAPNVVPENSTSTPTPEPQPPPTEHQVPDQQQGGEQQKGEQGQKSQKEEPTGWTISDWTRMADALAQVMNVGCLMMGKR